MCTERLRLGRKDWIIAGIIYSDFTEDLSKDNTPIIKDLTCDISFLEN